MTQIAPPPPGLGIVISTPPPPPPRLDRLRTVVDALRGGYDTVARICERTGVGGREVLGCLNHLRDHDAADRTVAGEDAVAPWSST